MWNSIKKGFGLTIGCIAARTILSFACDVYDTYFRSKPENDEKITENDNEES